MTIQEEIRAAMEAGQPQLEQCKALIEKLTAARAAARATWQKSLEENTQEAEKARAEANAAILRNDPKAAESARRRLEEAEKGAAFAQDTLDGLKTRPPMTPEAFAAMCEAVCKETDGAMIRCAEIAQSLLVMLDALWADASRREAEADKALIAMRALQDPKAAQWPRPGYDGSQRARGMHDERISFVSEMRCVLTQYTAAAYIKNGKEKRNGH